MNEYKTERDFRRLQGYLKWIIKHCDAPEKAARSSYRGMAAIKYVAELALAAAPTVPTGDARDARMFELGWRTAADWAERDDLIEDIGSPAYVTDCKAAIAMERQS